MTELTTKVLIVGAGPAGLAAAVAASEENEVTLIDDNPDPGGQIWRAQKGRTSSPEAAKLIAAIDPRRMKLMSGVTVFAESGQSTLLAASPKGTVEIKYEKVIIATGARERFLPFPGWTLPNVFGAGGLQALVKGGLDVRGKRVVIAGTGPLLLAVADYLGTKGASVLLTAEQTSAAKINGFVLGLWRSPGKLAQAVSLRRRLLGTNYLTDCWVTSVGGNNKVEYVEVTRKGKTWRIECEMVACGFHLVPSIELATLLGCKIDNCRVVVDDLQKTSIENIYCAGEPTGIGGVESSLIEGTIAGLAASDQIEQAEHHFKKRIKAHRFADALNSAFELREELRTLPNPETIVCRCEDVEYGQLTEFSNFREAKLQTRCGMGPCQGRICGTATEFLFRWKSGRVRAPIFPVKIEEL